MGDSNPSVAILIHQSSQWPYALRTGHAFKETGAAVTIFCLGPAPMTLAAPTAQASCIECYADSCQIGMPSMPLEAIAQRLKQCDLVIPI